MKRSKNIIASMLLSVVLCFGIVVTPGGCAKKPVIVNAPTGVNTTAVAEWYQATGAMLTLSEAAKAGPSVISTLYSNGAVDDTYKDSALHLMKDFDNGCLHIINVLQASPNNFNASTKTQVFAITQSMATELEAFNTEGGTHVKNPAALANFNELLASMKLAITMTQSLAGGK